MRLLYKGIGRGQSELMCFLIDRKSKKLEVFSSKTNYKFVDQPWKMLFDPGKEDVQEAQTDTLTDDQFEKHLDAAMLLVGYRRKPLPTGYEE